MVGLLFLILPLQAEDLIRSLEAGTLEERNKAQEQLIELGRKVLPLLEKALPGKDEETSTRLRKIIAVIPWLELVEGEARPILEQGLGGIKPKAVARDLAWGSEEQRLSRLNNMRGIFQPPLLPLMRRLLDDRSPRIRSMAAIWVADVGDKVSADRIARLLDDETVDHRLVLQALGQVGAARHAVSVEPLLKHPSAEVRAAGLHVLLGWGVGTGLEAARIGVDRENTQEALASIAYLGSFGTKEDHARLRTLVADPKEDRRMAAFHALRNLKASFDRDTLLNLLRKADQQSAVGVEVVPMILKEGEEALVPLGSLLNEDINLWVKHDILKRWDLQHYGIIQKAVAGQLTRGNEYQIAHAVEIMGRAKDRTLLDHVDRLLAHSSHWVRADTVTALARIDPKRAAGPVVRLLQEDPNSLVRSQAAGALQELEWTEALEKLCFERIDKEEVAPTYSLVLPLSHTLLKKSGNRAIPKLLALIRDPRTEHPNSIIRAFRAAKIPGHGLQLIEASRSFYWPLAEYLRQEKDPATLPAVKDRAEGGELDGRLAAIWTLGLLAPQNEAVPALARALDDPEPMVRAMALLAIGESRTARHYPGLRKFLDDHRLLRDRTDPLRERPEMIFSELCVSTLEAGYGERLAGGDAFEKAKAWKARLDRK